MSDSDKAATPVPGKPAEGDGDSPHAAQSEAGQTADRRVVFLSWGGQSSRNIASALQPILHSHFPDVDIFFSPTSIEVGEDPLKRMFDEGLERASVLVSVLTRDSASRPWVVWETATVWAKSGLVVPVFVDLSPGDVPGPLAVKVQGVRIGERQEIDRAVNRIARKLEVAENHSLSDEEWRQLSESVEVAAASASSEANIPANFSRQTVPLNNGLQTGTLLAIEVKAQMQLADARVLMTSIEGPSYASTIPTPARLYWHPGLLESTTIAQSAFSLINIARVGPMPPGAVMESPDFDLPWSLLDGAYRIGLQITASGYSARNISASFNVRSAGGPFSQSIEWMELVEF